MSDSRIITPSRSAIRLGAPASDSDGTVDVRPGIVAAEPTFSSVTAHRISRANGAVQPVVATARRRDRSRVDAPKLANPCGRCWLRAPLKIALDSEIESPIVLSIPMTSFTSIQKLEEALP